MTDPVIRCAGVSKRFGAIQAVADLDLEVARGGVLVLVGPSGCGKTTALRLIAGFEVPDAGAIEIGGRTVAAPGVFVPPERRRAGMVFQDYALFPHMTVEKNVAYGLTRQQARSGRVQEVLSLVGLVELEGRYPHELSGGQQQRVALARALAPNPDVILLDEPFSNLDPDLRAHVRAEVKEILYQARVTAVFVTHDRREAMNMGDLVAVMLDGHIEQVATPDGIYNHPATPYVAQFLGPAAFLPGHVQPGGIATEVGTIRHLLPLEPGTPLQVLLRPDDVTLQPSPQGMGTIVERELRGGFYRYQVQLPSGTVLQSMMPHTQVLPIGATVAVVVEPGHGLVCFQNGRTLLTQPTEPHPDPVGC